MTPFSGRIERIGDATLYLGDCRDILPGLGPVDACVTDPPYGIAYVKGSSGRQGNYRGKDAKKSRHIEAIHGDDAPFDPSHLLKYPNLLVWGANHYCHRLPQGKGRWLAWNKLEYLASFDDFSDVEFAWHSLGRASRIINYMWKGGLACRKAGESNGKRFHPTTKPVAVMEWCLKQIGDADLIVDPYMGSGTSGIACARRGRRFIGIEIDPAHFETACERLHGAHRQDLLAPAPQPLEDQRLVDLFAEPEIGK